MSSCLFWGDMRAKMLARCSTSCSGVTTVVRAPRSPLPPPSSSVRNVGSRPRQAPTAAAHARRTVVHIDPDRGTVTVPAADPTSCGAADSTAWWCARSATKAGPVTTKSISSPGADADDTLANDDAVDADTVLDVRDVSNVTRSAVGAVL